MTEATTVFTAPSVPYQNSAPAAAPVRLTGNPDTRPTNQDMGPQERWAADRAEIARNDPWQNPDIVLVRDPKTGAVVPHEKIVDANGEARAGKPIGQNADDPLGTTKPDDQTAPVGEKIQVGKFSVSEAELEQMLARQSAEDLRKATLPASPDKYELKVSEGAQLPGGQTFQFRADDPGLIAARNWAHAKGLSQDDFSSLLTIYASHEAQRAHEMQLAQAREIEKVGPNATQRVDAVDRFVRANMGDKDAATILRTMVSDAQLRFYEKMIHRIVSQGSGSYSPARREVPSETVTDEQWNAMTYSQKKEYSERASAQAGRR